MTNTQTPGYYKLPTTTVSQSRTAMFEPVTRLAPNKRKDLKSDSMSIPIAYGDCTVSGPHLTQIHRDIIEAIFTHNMKIIEDDAGDITFFINAYKIMRKMGHNRPDIKWFSRKIEEMRKANINLHTLGWNTSTGLVNRYKYLSDDNRFCKPECTKFGNNAPFAVQFSREYMCINALEIGVYYPKLVDRILGLSSALGRAVVRYCFTHSKPVHMYINTLLETIGAFKDISDRAKRMKVAELANIASELEEKFGIKIKEEMIYYSKHPQVWFVRPISAETVANSVGRGS